MQTGSLGDRDRNSLILMCIFMCSNAYKIQNCMCSALIELTVVHIWDIQAKQISGRENEPLGHNPSQRDLKMVQFKALVHFIIPIHSMQSISLPKPYHSKKFPPLCGLNLVKLQGVWKHHTFSNMCFFVCLWHCFSLQDQTPYSELSSFLTLNRQYLF